MKLNIYSIFDTASGLYRFTHFVGSDGEALRGFTDLVQNAEHPIGAHPEDYSIHRLGIFDDTTGTLSDELNTCLTTGLEAKANSQKVNSGNQLDLVKQIENQQLSDKLI